MAWDNWGAPPPTKRYSKKERFPVPWRKVEIPRKKERRRPASPLDDHLDQAKVKKYRKNKKERLPHNPFVVPGEISRCKPLSYIGFFRPKLVKQADEEGNIRFEGGWNLNLSCENVSKLVERIKERKRRKAEIKFEKMYRSYSRGAEYKKGHILRQMGDMIELVDEKHVKKLAILYEKWRMQVFEPIQRQIEDELNGMSPNYIKDKLRWYQYQYCSIANKQMILPRPDYNPFEPLEHTIKYSLKNVVDPCKHDIRKENNEKRFITLEVLFGDILKPMKKMAQISSSSNQRNIILTICSGTRSLLVTIT
ncbi:hypothetical protein SELMODRAFT_424816 [Selaginella moellendorffii]|uniref:Uncharacterized protein n=1 Tax=Selaginella moellendorffii TaxID=88036 RepID=D8SR40_SELML|nr:hypothetical protein SELMODRAFT_424816 [Selaginella moellendorffii]